jgi:hypothetical protein
MSKYSQLSKGEIRALLHRSSSKIYEAASELSLYTLRVVYHESINLSLIKLHDASENFKELLKAHRDS